MHAPGGIAHGRQFRHIVNDVVSCCCVTKQIFFTDESTGITLSQEETLTSDTFAGAVSIYPSRALSSLPCWLRQGYGPAELALVRHVPVVGWTRE
jgi:hypothetical protein